MLLKIHPDNPQARLIEKAGNIVLNDGVIIYRTDTGYSFGCGINSKKAMKRIYGIKKIDKKQPLTFICNNISQFQEYTKGINNQTFRKIKAVVPGSYTFILQASKMVPKVLLSPRATIGARIPDSQLTHMLCNFVGTPLLSSSVPLEDDEDVYNASLLHERFHKVVDLVIDSGDLFEGRTSIIDFSQNPPEVIREGDADISLIFD